MTLEWTPSGPGDLNVFSFYATIGGLIVHISTVL